MASSNTSQEHISSQEIYNHVSTHYSSVTPSASGNYEHQIAKAFGYSDTDLSAIPREANLGLSCGNPLALANLREGETVVDLGCGAGFDVFAAARKVGEKGQVFGVDMNEDMLSKAETTRLRLKNYSGGKNITFVHSEITAIRAVPPDSADCIISNCVINLVPSAHKHLVFQEMFRMLKPGGRVAISDILARKELSQEMRQSVGLYVGCFAGASLVGEYEGWLRDAGFREVLIVDAGSDLNVYFSAAAEESGDGAAESGRGDCCGGGGGGAAAVRKQGMSSVASAANGAAMGMGIEDLNEWAGSFQIYAVKTT